MPRGPRSRPGWASWQARAPDLARHATVGPTAVRINAMTVQPPPTYFPAPRRARFCGQCGTPINRRVPDGDNRERDICDHCGAIHYQNPRMVVGTVPVWESGILMCRRAIEPRYATWTLPEDFMR